METHAGAREEIGFIHLLTVIKYSCLQELSFMGIVMDSGKLCNKIFREKRKMICLLFFSGKI